MKNKILYFIFLIALNQVYSQIEIPYLQDFENFDANDELDNFRLLVDGDTIRQPYFYNGFPGGPIPPGLETSCNTLPGNIRPEGIIDDAEGYSWGLDNTKQTVGHCIKSTVHKEDHPYHAVGARSRSEFSISLGTLYKEETFFKYDIYIPNDAEFVDEPIDISTLPSNCDGTAEYEMHKILQLKASSTNYSDNGQVAIPYSFSSDRVILGMSYIHENNHWGNARDLYILIESTQDTGRSRRMQIRNGIIKGQWNEIIYKFYWSDEDQGPDAGYFQVWINRKSAILEADPQPHKPQSIKFADLYNIGTPSKILSSNISIDMAFDDDDDPATDPIIAPVQNYFPFGQYRRNHLNVHSIYFDNIRVTSEFPPLNNATKLIPEFCNAELEVDEMTVKCYVVPNATEYEFEFTEQGSNNPIVPNIVSSNNTLDLSSLDFLSSHIWYKIRIKTIVNGMSNAFGDPCWIKTPRHTMLLPEFWNKELSNNDLIIGCYPIPKAMEYIFRFQDGNGQNVDWITSTNTEVNILSANNLENNTWYKVYVREKNHDYNEYKWIKTPLNLNFKKTSGQKRNKNLRNSYIENVPVVYPNPFSTYLNVSNLHKFSKIRITSPTGQLVYTNEIISEAININLENISDGMYFLMVENKDGEIHSYKIIKK